MIINSRLARELAPSDQDPINAIIPFSAEYLEKTTFSNKPTRVIGVVEDFRHLGEFSVPGNVLFRRVRLDDAEGTRFSGQLSGASFGGAGPPSVLVIRVTADTTAALRNSWLRTCRELRESGRSRSDRSRICGRTSCGATRRLWWL